jgi:hypothetical protein
MAPDEAPELYPNDLYSSNPANPCTGCSGAANCPGECLRSQKLHADMETYRGMITYWQGQNGFEIIGKQDDSFLANRFDFRFKNDFTVRVYRIDSGGTPDRLDDIPEDVDLIVVERRLKGGPSDGDRQDPPWPDPDP